MEVTTKDKDLALLLSGDSSALNPTDENGKYIWIEIKGVELIEVVNYHGK